MAYDSLLFLSASDGLLSPAFPRQKRTFCWQDCLRWMPYEYASDKGFPEYVLPFRSFDTAEDKIMILGSVKFLTESSNLLYNGTSYHKKMADIVV